MSQMSSSGWLLAFIISLLLSLLMGLALVWLRMYCAVKPSSSA